MNALVRLFDAVWRTEDPQDLAALDAVLDNMALNHYTHAVWSDDDSSIAWQPGNSDLHDRMGRLIEVGLLSVYEHGLDDSTHLHVGPQGEWDDEEHHMEVARDLHHEVRGELDRRALMAKPCVACGRPIHEPQLAEHESERCDVCGDFVEVVPKPRMIADRTDIPARRASDYMRGVSAIPLLALCDVLTAFPYVDARWLVGELARRHRAKKGNNPARTDVVGR